MSMFGAYALVRLYKWSIWGKVITIIICLVLGLTGLLNILVIKNDVYTAINDYPSNKLMTWSVKNLPSNTLIFTNGEIYDPMTLIGKKIILGRVYYLVSYGGDVEKRFEEKIVLLKASDSKSLKEVIKKYNITYAVLYKNDFAKNPYEVNWEYYKKNFPIIYEDESGSVYKLN